MSAALAPQTLELCLSRQEEGESYLVFEYLYRDASNYKAFGELYLIGYLAEQERNALVGSLESEEFFVAEQVGVSPLYEKLHKMSGGRSQDDHAWHTFVGFRGELDLPAGVAIWGKATDLLAAIVATKEDWKPQLSSNFGW